MCTASLRSSSATVFIFLFAAASAVNWFRTDPTVLLASTAIGLFGHSDPSNAVNSRQPLPSQHLDLPQLPDSLLWIGLPVRHF